jgi:hypothetical protein
LQASIVQNVNPIANRMENLLIAKGDKTPLIEFKYKGELRIEGRSIPENPVEFYKQPIEWLKKFVSTKPQVVKVYVCLEHFNTASSKVLFDIFKYLEPLKKSGSDINLFWYHDENNPNMLEAGEDYASIIKYPFHFEKIILTNK